VTFTYRVTNTGNVPLSGVTVTDDNGTQGNTADDRVLTSFTGDTNGNGQLDVGETFLFTATRIATPAGSTPTSRRPPGTPPAAPPVTTPRRPDNHFVDHPGITSSS
jgi:hypothetical protein